MGDKPARKWKNAKALGMTRMCPKCAETTLHIALGVISILGPKLKLKSVFSTLQISASFTFVLFPSPPPLALPHLDDGDYVVVELLPVHAGLEGDLEAGLEGVHHGGGAGVDDIARAADLAGGALGTGEQGEWRQGGLFLPEMD